MNAEDLPAGTDLGGAGRPVVATDAAGAWQEDDRLEGRDRTRGRFVSADRERGEARGMKRLGALLAVAGAGLALNSCGGSTVQPKLSTVPSSAAASAATSATTNTVSTSAAYLGPPCSQMDASNSGGYSMCDSGGSSCPSGWHAVQSPSGACQPAGNAGDAGQSNTQSSSSSGGNLTTDCTQPDHGGNICYAGQWYPSDACIPGNTPCNQGDSTPCTASNPCGVYTPSGALVQHDPAAPTTSLSCSRGLKLESDDLCCPPGTPTVSNRYGVYQPLPNQCVAPTVVTKP